MTPKKLFKDGNRSTYIEMIAETNDRYLGYMYCCKRKKNQFGKYELIEHQVDTSPKIWLKSVHIWEPFDPLTVGTGYFE